MQSSDARLEGRDPHVDVGAERRWVEGFLVIGRHVVPVRRIPDQGIDVEHVGRQGPLNQVAAAGSAQRQRAFESAFVELQLNIGQRKVVRPRNEIAADLRAMRAQSDRKTVQGAQEMGQGRRRGRKMAGELLLRAARQQPGRQKRQEG